MPNTINGFGYHAQDNAFGKSSVRVDVGLAAGNNHIGIENQEKAIELFGRRV